MWKWRIRQFSDEFTTTFLVSTTSTAGVSALIAAQANQWK